MRDSHRVFLTILAVAIPAAVVATVVCVPRATSDRALTRHDTTRRDDPALVPIAEAPPVNAPSAAERDATDLARAVIDASDPEWETFARTSFDLLHRGPRSGRSPWPSRFARRPISRAAMGQCLPGPPVPLATPQANGH